MSKSCPDSMRKSPRSKRVRLSYSPPPPAEASCIKSGRKKKEKQNTKTSFVPRVNASDYDLTADGQIFTCEMCVTHHVFDPYKRRLLGGTKKILPRNKFDPVAGRYLMLCNACYIVKSRQSKKPVNKPDQRKEILEDEKEKYLNEGKALARSFAESFGDNNAERLFCPRFTSKPCRCIQTYIMSDAASETYRERVFYLLKLIRLAKKYSSMKCYDIKQVIAPSGKKKCKVGMGEGQKKSKVYEDFVLTQRKHLRDSLNLCETAIKTILCYSNNFLFKRLKSKESQSRVVKVKGKKGDMGGLKPIDEIGAEKCCHSQCAVMALSHGHLLQEWRDRAAQGQAEARRVVAEMLTPSGLHVNCYVFIKMVTGVTNSVISSVSSYMRETGGCRDPPPHGLKAFYEKHPKRTKPVSWSESDNQIEIEIVSATSLSTSHTQYISSLQTSSQNVMLENTSNPSTVDIRRDSSPEGAMEEHMELVQICNPDGTTQIIQVPVIACASLENEALLQDLSFSIPSSVVMETSPIPLLQTSDLTMDDTIRGSVGQMISESSGHHHVQSPDARRCNGFAVNRNNTLNEINCIRGIQNVTVHQSIPTQTFSSRHEFVSPAKLQMVKALSRISTNGSTDSLRDIWSENLPKTVDMAQNEGKLSEVNMQEILPNEKKNSCVASSADGHYPPNAQVVSFSSNSSSGFYTVTSQTSFSQCDTAPSINVVNNCGILSQRSVSSLPSHSSPEICKNNSNIYTKRNITSAEFCEVDFRTKAKNNIPSSESLSLPKVINSSSFMKHFGQKDGDKNNDEVDFQQFDIVVEAANHVPVIQKNTTKSPFVPLQNTLQCKAKVKASKTESKQKILLPKGMGDFSPKQATTSTGNLLKPFLVPVNFTAIPVPQITIATTQTGNFMSLNSNLNTQIPSVKNNNLILPVEKFTSVAASDIVMSNVSILPKLVTTPICFPGNFGSGVSTSATAPVNTAVSVRSKPIMMSSLPQNIPFNLKLGSNFTNSTPASNAPVISLANLTAATSLASVNAGFMVNSILPNDLPNKTLRVNGAQLVMPGLQMFSTVPQNGHFLSSNQKPGTIILHSSPANENGASGSFSVQHLTNQRVGSIAVEHLTSRLPAPRIGIHPSSQMPGIQLGLPQSSLIRFAGVLPSDTMLSTTSSKHHLRELLPLLPNATSPK